MKQLNRSQLPNGLLEQLDEMLGNLKFLNAGDNKTIREFETM